jgi:hypothetical protein
MDMKIHTHTYIYWWIGERNEIVTKGSSYKERSYEIVMK